MIKELATEVMLSFLEKDAPQNTTEHYDFTQPTLMLEILSQGNSLTTVELQADSEIEQLLSELLDEYPSIIEPLTGMVMSLMDKEPHFTFTESEYIFHLIILDRILSAITDHVTPEEEKVRRAKQKAIQKIESRLSYNYHLIKSDPDISQSKLDSELVRRSITFEEYSLLKDLLKHSIRA